jgi:hypothetical protein
VTATGQRSEDQAEPKSDRHELLVTILLVVAAVATSWCGYQASRWHGEQAEATSRTNAIRIEAARAEGLAEAQSGIDVATFIAWADANGRDERALATFYVDRFRPEFKTAFDAWRATNPSTNADAPPTPFAMPEYQVEATNEAERLDQSAEDSAADVDRNIQRADNYVLTVVLFAVALFFAGMSTKITGRRLRVIMVAAGYTILLAALAWVATFPVSLQI